MTTHPAAELVRINDQAVDISDVPANWTLADLIRYRTTLRGTHLACEHGVCGVCTVLLDGEPIRSCLVLSHAIGDRHVTTTEGLDLLDGDLAGQLRQAFLARNAFQCGFCTPGMLALVFSEAARVKADGDLRSDADDSAQARSRLNCHARELINANICRCTGYSAIIAAATDVLQQARQSVPRAQADE